MGKKASGPAIPIDLTRLPQFAPEEPPPRWPWVAVAAALVILVLGALVAWVLERSEARRDTIASPASEIVSRHDSLPITLPPLRANTSAVPVSHQIRRPLRITDTSAHHLDLNARVRDALAGFGYEAGPDDVFAALLIKNLAHQHSDAFIDAVVNAAYARGRIIVPPALLTPSGAVDTPRLFAALLNPPTG
jgi:hypothetical protein